MSNLLSPVVDLTYFGRTALMFLKSALVATRLVTRDYVGSAAAPGHTIEIPSLVVEGDAATRAIGGAATASDVSSHTRTLELSHVYKSLKIDDLERFFSSVPILEDGAAQLAYAVAAKCDALVLAAAALQSPYEAGEIDGTDLFNATDKVGALNRARRILSDNKAPLERLVAILNPAEAENLRDLDLVKIFSDAGSSELLREGELGRIYGFGLFESQQIPNLTVSAAAATNSPGAIDNASGYPIGTGTIHVDGLGAGTVAAGTSFLLGSWRYVVTADATITGNEADLEIYPNLKAAAVDDAVVAFTEHSAAGSVNVAFHPSAILAINRTPVAWPENSGVRSEVVTDDQTGLSLRVSVQSQVLGGAGSAFSNSLTIDTTFGSIVQRPELIVRLFGSTT